MYRGIVEKERCFGFVFNRFWEKFDLLVFIEDLFFGE